MKKRALSLILAVVMVCALLPTAALAADSDFIIENGVLTQYTGFGGDVVIPDSVTSIGPRAFFDCGGMTSVTIGNGVTSIGDDAFRDCVGLTGVTIPDSVTSMGWGVFMDCGLTSVTIPDSVTEIGPYAFFDCYDLTSVTIPNGVTSIGDGAFGCCYDLTSVIIPDSVTEIAVGAFYACGLTSVTIPNGVTSIGDGAFAYCPNLTDIYYGGTEAQWKVMGIGDNNAPLYSATIHYNSAMPTVTPTAYPSTQSVLVDGQAVEFQCYALKDENGFDTNYIKLRDVADILNGSAAQFEVGWNGDIAITTGQSYTKNGSEQNTPFSGQRAYEKSASATLVNGVAADLDAIVLTDDAGGGYTYYKLRDLGGALGFKVDWSAEKGIFIETK